MATLDVITAGEAMVLFAAREPAPLEQASTFARSTAGAELNVAIGLSRLGLRTAYVTRLGDDSFGRHIAATLAREGIDASHAAVDRTRPTGFMLKSRSDDGSDPRTEYFRRGSAASAIEARDLPRDLVQRARHLHLTGIYCAVSPSARDFVVALAGAARDAGLSISFDPNLRPSLWPSTEAMIAGMGELACFADWVLPGLEEGRLLTRRADATPQDIAAHYLDRGARGVIVKLGAHGAYWATASDRGQAPGVRVERVVDTVGAGDGFAVGVISALLEGASLAQAAARGNAIGARVVQFPGDCDGLPTREQMREMEAGR
jgi:sugar/nucleoside kinase (ribokinase family)